jgi:hypothetical protein
MKDYQKRIASTRALALLILTFAGSSAARAQSAPGVLTSRTELAAAAEAAPGRSASGAMQSAAIRQRLKDGDFQVGDRIVVTVVANETRTDTVIVRTGRVIELPGKIAIPLTGVLRSELQQLVEAEVLKFVKAHQVVATPLLRLAILGEVARPGYFAFASDIPLTEAIMGAGGPSALADLERSIVRRGDQQYRSAKDTKAAIAKGLTLDQFGLTAGDELVVGRRRELLNPSALRMIGIVTSLVSLSIALNR